MDNLTFHLENYNMLVIFAYMHTAKQIRNMENRGIQILSFFIDGDNYDMRNFQKMYGKSAKGIKVDQLLPLAKELNKMFV